MCCARWQFFFFACFYDRETNRIGRVDCTTVLLYYCTTVEDRIVQLFVTGDVTRFSASMKFIHVLIFPLTQGRTVNTSEIKTNDDNSFMWEVRNGSHAHHTNPKNDSGCDVIKRRCMVGNRKSFNIGLTIQSCTHKRHNVISMMSDMFHALIARFPINVDLFRFSRRVGCLTSWTVGPLAAIGWVTSIARDLQKSKTSSQFKSMRKSSTKSAKIFRRYHWQWGNHREWIFGQSQLRVVTRRANCLDCLDEWEWKWAKYQRSCHVLRAKQLPEQNKSFLYTWGRE